jgi:hypothetical protein
MRNMLLKPGWKMGQGPNSARHADKGSARKLGRAESCRLYAIGTRRRTYSVRSAGYERSARLEQMNEKENAVGDEQVVMMRGGSR